MDLPAHAGVIALRTAYPGSDFLRQYFVLDPHLGGYSAFRFLGDHLAEWIGPMAAIRTLASLPVLALPVAVLYARKRLYGDADPFFACAALILCFGFMTVLGFASYMISLAVLMIAVTEWLVLMAKTDAGKSTISQKHVRRSSPLSSLSFTGLPSQSSDFWRLSPPYRQVSGTDAFFSSAYLYLRL
jgi:hypothetical protein